jgi:hypothetical protein
MALVSLGIGRRIFVFSPAKAASPTTSIRHDNFSNLTSGVLAVAAPRYLGATIGLYSCIGFGASFLGTLLFGLTLDQFGGTSQLAAWVVSFGTCGLACLAGAAATIFLPRNIWQR